MPDYIITLKVRCRKRSVLQDIERITSMGRFQESFEFAIANYLEERLRGAYLDVSDVDVSARFNRKRKASVRAIPPVKSKPAKKVKKAQA